LKVISLYAARAGIESKDFQDWFLTEHADQLMKHCPGLKRYIINIIDVAPPEGRDYEETPRERSRNSYEVTSEMWFESLEDYTDLAKRYDNMTSGATIERDLSERTRRVCSYVVDESYQILRPHPSNTLGERLPGIKSISLALWNMSDWRARDFWREHAARALPHHPGVSKYVQNWVLSALTPYAVPVQGIAELFFPTEEDFRERSIDSPEGAALVARDVREHQATTALYGGEYLMKGTDKPTGLNADFLNYTTV
jgi:hypothetical protein